MALFNVYVNRGSSVLFSQSDGPIKPNSDRQQRELVSTLDSNPEGIKHSEHRKRKVKMKVDVNGFPVAQGLYDPQYEKDACGVGYVVNIDGIPSNKVK